MITESTVRDILRQKGVSQVWTIEPEDTVFEAIRTMGKHNIGALLVMHGEQIEGMLTEREYSRRVALQNRSSRNTTVSEIMVRNVLFVVPEDIVSGVLTLMTEKRIRHVPVLEQGRLIGLISMGDVVKTVISDQEFLIDQLTRYLTGSYAPQNYSLTDPRVAERAVST